MKYIAYLPCGCVQGIALVDDTTESRNTAAKYVRMWVKGGLQISTLEDEVMLNWNCEKHEGEF